MFRVEPSVDAILAAARVRVSCEIVSVADVTAGDKSTLTDDTGAYAISSGDISSLVTVSLNGMTSPAVASAAVLGAASRRSVPSAAVSAPGTSGAIRAGIPATGITALPLAGSGTPAFAARASLVAAGSTLLAAVMQAPSPLTCDLTFFGPNRFTRTKDQVDYTVQAELPDGLVGPFLLNVINGEPDPVEGEDGWFDYTWTHWNTHASPNVHLYRVTSARLLINGVEVAHPNEFQQKIDGFVKEVDLVAGPNTLDVELSGKKGTFLTIGLCGTILDATPPDLSVAAPPAGASLPTLRPDILVRYPDVPGPGEAIPSGTATDTLSVLLDGTDITAALVVRADEAEGVAPADLIEGLHVLEVSVEDAKGNRADAAVQFRVDVTAPLVGVSEPANGAFLASEAATIRVTYADVGGVDLGSLRIEVNGTDRSALFSVGAAEAVALTDASWGLLSGPNSVQASVSDEAGNLGQAASVFNVDTTAPVVTMGQPVDGARLGTVDVDVLVQFSDDQELDLTSFVATLDLNQALFFSAASSSGEPLA